MFASLLSLQSSSPTTTTSDPSPSVPSSSTLPISTSNNNEDELIADDALVIDLVMAGFDNDDASKALIECGNDFEGVLEGDSNTTTTADVDVKEDDDDKDEDDEDEEEEDDEIDNFKETSSSSSSTTTAIIPEDTLIMELAMDLAMFGFDYDKAVKSLIANCNDFDIALDQLGSEGKDGGGRERDESPPHTPTSTSRQTGKPLLLRQSPKVSSVTPSVSDRTNPKNANADTNVDKIGKINSPPPSLPTPGMNATAVRQASPRSSAASLRNTRKQDKGNTAHATGKISSSSSSIVSPPISPQPSSSTSTSKTQSYAKAKTESESKGVEVDKFSFLSSLITPSLPPHPSASVTSRSSGRQETTLRVSDERQSEKQNQRQSQEESEGSSDEEDLIVKRIRLRKEREGVNLISSSTSNSNATSNLKVKVCSDLNRKVKLNVNSNATATGNDDMDDKFKSLALLLTSTSPSLSLSKPASTPKPMPTPTPLPLKITKPNQTNLNNIASLLTLATNDATTSLHSSSSSSASGTSDAALLNALFPTKSQFKVYVADVVGGGDNMSESESEFEDYNVDCGSSNIRRSGSLSLSEDVVDDVDNNGTSDNDENEEEEDDDEEDEYSDEEDLLLQQMAARHLGNKPQPPTPTPAAVVVAAVAVMQPPAPVAVAVEGGVGFTHESNRPPPSPPSPSPHPKSRSQPNSPQRSHTPIPVLVPVRSHTPPRSCSRSPSPLPPPLALTPPLASSPPPYQPRSLTPPPTQQQQQQQQRLSTYIYPVSPSTRSSSLTLLIFSLPLSSAILYPVRKGDICMLMNVKNGEIEGCFRAVTDACKDLLPLSRVTKKSTSTGRWQVRVEVLGSFIVMLERREVDLVFSGIDFTNGSVHTSTSTSESASKKGWLTDRIGVTDDELQVLFMLFESKEWDGRGVFDVGIDESDSESESDSDNDDDDLFGVEFGCGFGGDGNGGNNGEREGFDVDADIDIHMNNVAVNGDNEGGGEGEEEDDPYWFADKDSSSYSSYSPDEDEQQQKQSNQRNHKQIKILPQTPQNDQTIAAIISMGFSLNAAKKALLAQDSVDSVDGGGGGGGGNPNDGDDVTIRCIDWILGHGDGVGLDFDDDDDDDGDGGGIDSEARKRSHSHSHSKEYENESESRIPVSNDMVFSGVQARLIKDIKKEKVKEKEKEMGDSKVDEYDVYEGENSSSYSNNTTTNSNSAMYASSNTSIPTPSQQSPSQTSKPTRTSSIPCKMFRHGHGTCTKGDTCRFLHSVLTPQSKRDLSRSQSALSSSATHQREREETMLFLLGQDMTYTDPICSSKYHAVILQVHFTDPAYYTVVLHTGEERQTLGRDLEAFERSSYYLRGFVQGNKSVPFPSPSLIVGNGNSGNNSGGDGDAVTSEISESVIRSTTTTSDINPKSSTIRTSAVTVLPTRHAQIRQLEREISKKELQSAKKHGVKETMSNGNMKFTYNQFVYVTDHTQRVAVTTYKLEDGRMNGLRHIKRLDVHTLDWDAHAYSLKVLRSDPSSWVSHTVIVIDQSGSMNEEDVSGYMNRFDAVYCSIAENFILLRMREMQGDLEEMGRNVISLIAMSGGVTNDGEECKVLIKEAPLNKILYNHILELRDKQVPASHASYIPALRKVEELLGGNESSKVALSCFFLSDGRPSDKLAKGGGYSCEGVLQTTYEKQRKQCCDAALSLGKKLGSRLFCQFAAFGPEDEDFSIMDGMTAAVKEYGAQAVFNKLNLKNAKTDLTTALTGHSSSLTSTIASLSELRTGGSKVKKVRTFGLEGRSVVEASFHSIEFEMNENWRLVKNPIRRAWSLDLETWTNKPLLSDEDGGEHFAMRNLAFGQGAERVVFQGREVRGNESTFCGPLLVSKESRFEENMEDHNLSFHECFAKTQATAGVYAFKFNEIIAGLKREGYVDVELPFVDFIECSVYSFQEDAYTRKGVLVEQMLEERRYVKWNGNNGYVNVTKDVEVDFKAKARKEAKDAKEKAAFRVVSEWSLLDKGIQETIFEEDEDEEDEEEEEEEIDEDDEGDEEEEEENKFIQISPNDLLQTFTHFTYLYTGGKKLCCDIQGVFDVGTRPPSFQLTDPVIHNTSVKGGGGGGGGKERKNDEDGGERGEYGKTDKGQKGVDDFFKTHNCNPICNIIIKIFTGGRGGGVDEALYKRFRSGESSSIEVKRIIGDLTKQREKMLKDRLKKEANKVKDTERVKREASMAKDQREKRDRDLTDFVAQAKVKRVQEKEDAWFEGERVQKEGVIKHAEEKRRKRVDEKDRLKEIQEEKEKSRAEKKRLDGLKKWNEWLTTQSLPLVFRKPGIVLFEDYVKKEVLAGSGGEGLDAIESIIDSSVGVGTSGGKNKVEFIIKHTRGWKFDIREDVLDNDYYERKLTARGRREAEGGIVGFIEKWFVSERRGREKSEDLVGEGEEEEEVGVGGLRGFLGGFLG